VSSNDKSGFNLVLKIGVLAITVQSLKKARGQNETKSAATKNAGG
jgi:hypothetical protein